MTEQTEQLDERTGFPVDVLADVDPAGRGRR